MKCSPCRCQDAFSRFSVHCTWRDKPQSSWYQAVFFSHQLTCSCKCHDPSKRARGLFKRNIFYWLWAQVGIRNYFKALTELRGSCSLKGSYINQDSVYSHADFLPPFLASATHVFSSLSKGEKLHFHSVVQTNNAVLCIFPDHQARRKISGTPLGTPRVEMFPVVPAAVYRAGFHLLLFWHTLALCWLAQQYLAIVPCLRGISSWIRIQSLC